MKVLLLNPHPIVANFTDRTKATVISVGGQTHATKASKKLSTK